MEINKTFVLKYTLGTLFLLSISLFTKGQDKTQLLSNGQWINRLSKSHPRLFLNSASLSTLKQRVKTDLKTEFEALCKYVDGLPAEAPVTLKTELFTNYGSNSKLKPIKASLQARNAFTYSGGDEAVQAALAFLITRKPEYLQKSKSYLKLANHIFSWSADNEIWVDLTGNTRINALTAYDWLYNDLSETERKEILLPILNYIKLAQPSGGFKFRRTLGNHKDGNYGEGALEWFAGLAAYGDGIDDVLAEKMLRRGAGLFVDMMDWRDDISAGSGLLSTITPTYSFINYPYTTFNFLHTWQSAFNEDITGRWTQMLDYGNWFDWAAIKVTKNNKMIFHGIGDVEHRSNSMFVDEMYTHLAQTIHFYSKKQPEKMKICYEIQSRLTKEKRIINTQLFPFLPFLLSNFNPEKLNTIKADPIIGTRYFYNKSFGVLLMRSGKTEHDTYASFRFGSKYINHQHYDELSFIIYKNNFLALDAGSRTETDHHHNFAPQSVAHNTILIHEPKEEMPHFWKAWSYKPDGKVYYNHGGQNNNTNTKAIALQSTEDFIYAAGDATKAYSAIKSKEVTRQFVYLKPDLFVIYDRVASAKEDQTKEFIIHFQNKPQQIDSKTWYAEHDGHLFVRTLLPEKANTNVIGGPGREFEASGRNWELPGGSNWDKEQKLTGKWRIEVSPPDPIQETRFLHVLQAASAKPANMIDTRLIKGINEDIVVLTDPAGTKWELKFNRHNNLSLKLKQTLASGTIKFDGELKNSIEPQP
jgi:hypothetical protein